METSKNKITEISVLSMILAKNMIKKSLNN